MSKKFELTSEVKVLSMNLKSELTKRMVITNTLKLIN